MIKKNKVKDLVNVVREVVEKYHNDPSRKKNLLEDETESPLYLQITLKKIPNRKNVKMIKVPLPNSKVKDVSNTCLITGDLDKKDKKAEIDPDILHYKELLKSHGVTCISEVVTLRQLRTEYKPYEAKQKLLGAFDVFLADKKIAGVLPKVLGRHFFKKRKYPIQIDLKKKYLKKEIENALSAKVLFLTGHGNSCLLEVANLDMEDSEIVENIMAAVNTLSEKLPGSWDNVMGLYLKTNLSIAVPLYMSYDIPDDIQLDEKNEMDIIEDDLSTLPNAGVRVYSDGKVERIRSVQKSDKDERDDDDISSIEGEELQDSREKRKRSGKTQKNLLLPECDQSDEKILQKSRKKPKRGEISLKFEEIAASVDSEEPQAKADKTKKSKKQNKGIKQTVPLSTDLEDSQAVKSPIKTKNTIKLEKQSPEKKHVDSVLNDSENSQAIKSEVKPKMKKSKKQVINAKDEDNLHSNSAELQTIKLEVKPKMKNSKKQVISTENEENLRSNSADSQSVKSEVKPKMKKSKKQVISTEDEENLHSNSAVSLAKKLIETKKIKKEKKQTLSNDSEDDELSNQNKKANKRKRVDSESAPPKAIENRNKFESPVQPLKKMRPEGNMKKHLAMKEARKNKKKENCPRSK